VDLTSRGLDALLGRIYAQQQDSESLGKWASATAESANETAAYWFAMGVYKA
jgi:hypothetical protein